MIHLILLAFYIHSCQADLECSSRSYCIPRPTDVPCSANYDCECYSMAIGGQICANSQIPCSNLTSCNPDGVTCSESNTICVTNTRCQRPVCYPIVMADSQTQCPPPKPITTTETPLPPQCWNYTLNTDGTRHVNSSSGPKCDPNEFAYLAKWVRFSGAAGTLLATSMIPPNHCGAYYTGYYTGLMPTQRGDTVTGKVCYNWNTNTCYMSNMISVTNCKDFFVYALVASPNCSGRYCTI
ncbi:unnamed protein product [Rotaria magnacalcarata]|uniref:Uncharacterized protein n=1 Tax=Rotaria magnacalcarata TaxID=392030 RepID=A0A816GIJ2_9BILA|nr:unnamed protein product [Rotaria magnacalcarata]CAF2064137.1 unnamed protein product [Rotaria magnacalcarata]